MGLLGALALTIVLGSYGAASAATQTGSWETITVKDEWGNPTGQAVVSGRAEASPTMAPPYHDVLARLMIEDCRDVLIRFTTPPNLMEGMVHHGIKLRSGIHRTLRLRARWNDRTKFRVKARQRSMGKDIHLAGRIKVAQIAGNQSLSVVLNWYGDGDVAWRFPLEGAREALAARRVPVGQWGEYATESRSAGGAP